MTILLVWILQGGWKYVFGAVILTGIMLYAWHIKTQADKVPGLQAQIVQQTKQITIMQKADADRQKIDLALSAWQRTKDTLVADFRKGMRNAPIAVLPECAPKPIDRELRNNALSKLLSSSTSEVNRKNSETSVPAN